MTSYDRRVRALAIALAGLAGFVDALAFVAMGGFFASFMSGNSTRLGVGIAQHSAPALFAGMLIASFVAGVVGGSLLGRRAGARQRPVVLLLVAGLLAGGAALSAFGLVTVAVCFAAAAMGAENAAFEAEGEVRFGLTYMTGTLVKIGQRVATVLLGGNGAGLGLYLTLWGALVAGAALGTALYPLVGLSGLWGAAAFALAAACLDWRPAPLRVRA